MAEVHPIYELTTGKELGIAGNTVEIVSNHFGLSKNLLDQISKLSKSVSSLGRMVFSNEAEDIVLDQVHIGEGRGTYHRDGDGNVIYVKGTGSRSLLGDQNHGFPSTTSSLLHEFSPRVMGASDMVENVIEYVNAYIVFAGAAQESGWVDLKNVVEAGATVPLNLVEFDEMSSKTEELWNASKDRKRKYPSIGWDSLGGIGTISMLVPSNERISNHIFNNFIEREPIDSQLLNPEHVAPVCRSIRELLKMGMIYYYDGFHAQNFFDKGSVPQADNAEICFVSRILEKSEGNRNRVISYLSEQLESLDEPGLFERKRGNASYEQYMTYMRSFMKNILGEQFNDRMLRRYTLLACLDKNAFHNALALRIFTELESSKWVVNANLQDQCLDQLPQASKRVHDKDQEFADKLNSSWIYQMGEMEFNRARSLSQAIFEGEEEVGDDYVDGLIDLLNALDQMSNKDIDNTIFQLSRHTASVYYMGEGYNSQKRLLILEAIRNKDIDNLRELMEYRKD